MCKEEQSEDSAKLNYLEASAIVEHVGPQLCSPIVSDLPTCWCTLTLTILGVGPSSRCPPSYWTSFGCGKTRTLFECVKLLMLYTDSTHLLVCTHSNSAADLYVEYLHKQWTSESIHLSHSLSHILSLSHISSHIIHMLTLLQYCTIHSGGH